MPKENPNAYIGKSARDLGLFMCEVFHEIHKVRYSLFNASGEEFASCSGAVHLRTVAINTFQKGPNAFTFQDTN